MTASSDNGADQIPIRLPWDSNEFGFEVGRLACADLDDVALENALALAATSAFTLIYWSTTPSRSPRADLLERFGGELVDRKVTYTRTLPARSLTQPVESGQGEDAYSMIREYPAGPASSQLIALAIAAGQQSRYRRDRRFPYDVFQRLYTTWIDRSTRREIADVVLSAVDAQGNALGVISLSKREDTCQTGIVAVDAASRRVGIAKRLLGAAHEWGAARGATRASVVTQAENLPARRLYEHCGYQLHDVTHIYHFWPR